MDRKSKKAAAAANNIDRQTRGNTRYPLDIVVSEEVCWVVIERGDKTILDVAFPDGMNLDRRHLGDPPNHHVMKLGGSNRIVTSDRVIHSAGGSCLESLYVNSSWHGHVTDALRITSAPDSEPQEYAPVSAVSKTSPFLGSVQTAVGPETTDYL